MAGVLQPHGRDADASFMQLVSAGEAKAQDGDIDGAIADLEGALEVGTSDLAARGVVHCQLGNCLYRQGNLQLAAKHHEADLYCARKLQDHAGAIQAYGNLGHTLRATRQFDAALECYSKQCQLAQASRDRPAHCKALGNLGAGHMAHAHCLLAEDERGQARDAFVLAATQLKLQLRLAESLRDNAGVGKAAGNLGIIYEQLDDFDKAVTYHKKRLKVAEAADDRAAMGRAHCNLGNAHRALGNLRQAIESYEKDLAIAAELEDLIGEGITCSNLGNAHQALGHIEETKQFHQRHLDIVTRLGHKEGMVWAFANLGRVHEAVGDFDKALSFFGKQVDLGREMADPRTERSGNRHIARVKRHQEEGVTVDHESAVLALMNALESADGRHKAISKRTVRGTLGRMFGRPPRKTYQRPSIVQSNESLNSQALSELSEATDATGDSGSGSFASTSFSRGSSSPNPSSRSDPGPGADSGTWSMRRRLSSVFRQDPGSLAVPEQPSQTQRSITPESERRQGSEERLPATPSPEPPLLGGGEVQDTSIDEARARPPPLQKHASRGAELLAALGGLESTWRTNAASAAAPASNHTVLRM